MAEINLSIAPLVYVRGLVTLQAAVDAAKSIEAGFRIIQRNGIRFNFTTQQPVENGMKVLAVILEKILIKKEENKVTQKEVRTLSIKNVMNQNTFLLFVNQKRSYLSEVY